VLAATAIWLLSFAFLWRLTKIIAVTSYKKSMLHADDLFCCSSLQTFASLFDANVPPLRTSSLSSTISPLRIAFRVLCFLQVQPRCIAPSERARKTCAIICGVKP
jgi:hypothetical protein